MVKMITLHPYQATDVTELVNQFKNVKTCAVLYCTAAGKTTVSHTVATLMNVPFVIAAPTNNIKSAFVSCNNLVSIDGEIIHLANIDIFKDKQSDRLRGYLCNDKFPGYGIVVSHALLTRDFPGISCRGKLLIVDEGHHAGMRQKISAFINYWLAAGGFVLYLTATPIRANNTDSLACDAEFTVTRTTQQQMRAGFAPTLIEYDLIKINSESHNPANDDVVGAPMDIDELCKELYFQMEKDGFPKAIVRCKNLGDKFKNDTVIEKISNHLEDQGIRVFPATESTRLRDLDKTLITERGIKTFNQSQYDVIVGINAVIEGMDWPIASHVYLIGIPTSRPLAVQCTGRVMRLRNKWPDYPNTWKMISKVAMITGNVSNIEPKHAGAVLRVVSYLASMKSLDILKIVKEKFNNKIGIEDQKRVIKKIESLNVDAPPEAHEAIIKIQTEFYHLVHASRPLTRKNIVDLFEYYKDQKEFECDITDIKLALASQSKKEIEEKLGNKLVEELNDTNLNASNMDNIIQDAFSSVVDEFINDTEVPCNAATDFGKIQSLHVNSQVIESFAHKIENVRKIDFSEAIK